jgi:hypothetical protein
VNFLIVGSQEKSKCKKALSMKDTKDLRILEKGCYYRVLKKFSLEQ